MDGVDIVIAGAGAIGSAAAWRLARAGRRVAVVDPQADSASSVAAGMLAPAFECVFDAPAAGGYALLAQARDLWPALAAGIGLPLSKDGALATGSRLEAQAWVDALAAAGAGARLLAPAEAAACAPGLPAGAWAAFTPDDWRLEPAAALDRLRTAAKAHGASFVTGQVRGFNAGRVAVDGAEDLRAGLLVIATGASRALAGLAPELSGLAPIKGHILRAEGAFAPAPTVRANGVYLCRSDGAAVLGATMEEGVADADVDPAVVSRLLAAGQPLTAGLGPLAWRAAAGVRAATADGLPLVGCASAAGVVLAVGARRNGWLLAPMIAEALLAAVEGRAPGAAAAAFDPCRAGVRSHSAPSVSSR
jgi:glycine oxidase